MVLLYSHCATFFRNVALTQKETWLCSLSWDYELKSMLRRVWFISGENLCLFVALIQFNAVTTTRTSQPKDSHPLENLKFYFGSEQACWSRFQTWIFRSRSRHCQPEHSRDPRVHLTTYRRILKLNSWRCKLDTFIAHMRTIRYDTTVALGLSNASSCSSLCTPHASRRTAPASCRNASTRSPKGGQSPAPWPGNSSRRSGSLLHFHGN